MKRQTKIKRSIQKRSLRKRQTKSRQSGGALAKGFAFVAKYKAGLLSSTKDVIVKLSFTIASGFRFSIHDANMTTIIKLLPLAGYSDEPTLEAAQTRIFPHNYKEIMDKEIVKEETVNKDIQIEEDNFVVINGKKLMVSQNIIPSIKLLFEAYKIIADSVKSCEFAEKNNAQTMRKKRDNLKEIKKKICSDGESESFHSKVHRYIGKFNDIVNGKSPVTEEAITEIIDEANLLIELDEIDERIKDATINMLTERLRALKGTSSGGGSRRRKRNYNKSRLNKNRTKRQVKNITNTKQKRSRQ
jgi:hypothetical protein